MEESGQRPDYLPNPRARLTIDSSNPHPHHSYTMQDEKENIVAGSVNEPPEDRAIPPPMITTRRHSPPLQTRMRMSSSRLHSNGYGVAGHRPLVDVPVPQRAPPTSRQLPGANRVARVIVKPPTVVAGLKRSTTSAVDRVGEVMEVDPPHPEMESRNDDTEPEDEPLNHPSPVEVAVVPNALRRRRDLSGAVHPAGGALEHSNNRPRRSASLSDAHQHDDYRMQVVQPHQVQATSRPGTSLGTTDTTNNPGGARRVAPEERERQELEARAAEYRRDIEQSLQHRASQSPTHTQTNAPAQLHVRTAVGHRRRDSDTVRGGANSRPNSALLGSPTVNENNNILQARRSPSGNRYGVGAGRASPSTRSNLMSPGVKRGGSPQALASSLQGRFSPPGTVRPVANGNGRERDRDYGGHRRNPTAPEPSTHTNNTSNPNTLESAAPLRASSSQRIRPPDNNDNEDEGFGSGEKDRERERQYELQRERERRERPHQRESDAQDGHYGRGGQQNGYGHPAQGMRMDRHPTAGRDKETKGQFFYINKMAYARLDMVGKGGSSRVYRVLSKNNELFAIKKVSLDKIDSETMNSYMNEIALLKRLDGNDRIIRLVDSEVRPGPDGGKGSLMLVMECGEIDFARLMSERVGQALNMVWVSYYWQQMLQAVHVIHEEKIVHSDLKPANFVLVKGQLKLIDFGIANAIANDTTNIQRDHQIGTVNYMSPEAIELPDGKRRLKVGRPSDVWSLGCIIYQMVYGHPPFQHLAVYHKMKAIPDARHIIDFPEYSTPSTPTKNGMRRGEPSQPQEHLKRRVPKAVIDCMKGCLVRNPKERATIPELLEQKWLTGDDSDEATAAEGENGKEKPTLASLLKPDQTIITPYYMRQLLMYGMSLGGANTDTVDEEALLVEAKNLVNQLRSITTETEQ